MSFESKMDCSSQRVTSKSNEILNRLWAEDLGYSSRRKTVKQKKESAPKVYKSTTMTKQGKKGSVKPMPGCESTFDSMKRSISERVSQLKVDGREVTYQQGNKTITQLWREGEKAWDLIEHKIIETKPDGKAVTKMSFNGNAADISYNFKYNSSLLSDVFATKHIDNVDKRIELDILGKNKNPFESVINSELHSPDNLGIAVDESIKAQVKADFYKNNAVSDSNKPTKMVKSIAKRLDSARLSNIKSNLGCLVTLAGGAILAVLGFKACSS